MPQHQDLAISQDLPVSDNPPHTMQTKTQTHDEERQAQAMKIMSEARKQLSLLGLEVSLIARAPSGAKWPVLMLHAGETFGDIEAVRQASTK